MADLKLVVFDVDGTLIDSIAHIETVMDQAFTANDLPKPQPGAVRNLIGVSLLGLLDKLHPGLSETQLHRLAQTYMDMFSASSTTLPIQQTAPLFPGARAALEALRAREDLLLGLATGKSRRGLNRLLDAHTLDMFFVTTHVADDHPSKPHPAMLLATLTDTGVDAESAIMIGDTSFDLDMARAAGVKSVGVGWGNHPVETLQANADAILHDFAKLPDLIDELLVAR
ncbi:MAG: HAD-IA family hydrolase [Pseudomonadota bacterium]